MEYVFDWTSRKIFMASFGVSTLFEVIFGIPSCVFVITPFIITSLTDGDTKLLLSCSFLATVFLCAIGGLITFILQLVGRNKQIRMAQNPGDEWWYNLKTYDNFNAVVVVLLGISSAMHGFAEYDVFVPVAKAIYLSQIDGYHEFNPSCHSETSEIKTGTEIFVDDLQEKYSCCGWRGPSDWYGRLDTSDRDRLPYSCCPKSLSCKNQDLCRVSDEKHFTVSCKEPAIQTFKRFDTTSYNMGIVYFVAKGLAYLTYCNSYKHIIEVDVPLLSKDAYGL